MDNKDFVTYEIAKRLKEAGFNEPCDHYYHHGELKRYADTDSVNRNTNGHGRPNKCSAPTLWQAQKWLREKHNIHVQIEAVMQEQWTYTLVDLAPWSDMDGEWHDRIPDREGYPQIATYESALSAGIAAALELITPQPNKTMAKTIEEMAREYAKVKVGDYDYLGNEYEAYLDGNEDAIKYVLSLPLSSRLTESEREKIRELYNHLKSALAYCHPSADRIVKDALHDLESIFGKSFYTETK